MVKGKALCEPLTSTQKVVNALVFPQGREVKVIHQCVQAILKGEEKGLTCMQANKATVSTTAATSHTTR